MNTTEQVLLLNGDGIEPLGLIAIKRAVRLLYDGKAEVVYDNGQLLHSAGQRVSKKVWECKLPSILRLLYYVVRPFKGVVLSKKNVLLRDEHRCGYCNLHGGPEMTVDHILPKSKGGKSTWQNLVTSCSSCNSRKGNRTPEEANMPLLRTPRKPKFIPFAVVRKHTLPNEWVKYLNLWSISIEERIC